MPLDRSGPLLSPNPQSRRNESGRKRKGLPRTTDGRNTQETEQCGTGNGIVPYACRNVLPRIETHKRGITAADGVAPTNKGSQFPIVLGRVTGVLFLLFVVVVVYFGSFCRSFTVFVAFARLSVRPPFHRTKPYKFGDGPALRVTASVFRSVALRSLNVSVVFRFPRNVILALCATTVSSAENAEWHRFASDHFGRNTYLQTTDGRRTGPGLTR